MTKLQWARLMVGCYGYDKNYGMYQIISFVNFDTFSQTPIVEFIIETNIGLPGFITKKFLQKYHTMSEEDIKNSFKSKAVENFPTEEDFDQEKETREKIRAQIEKNRMK